VRKQKMIKAKGILAICIIKKAD